MALPNYVKEEYSGSIADRFAKSGSLFLVDYSKHCALKSLLPLLLKEKNAALLLIAENADAAADFATALRASLGEVDVVKSAEALAGVLGTSLRSPRQALREAAATLSAKHRRLIVSAKDASGAPLLHRELCVNDGKSGAYAGVDAAPFCVSDLLAEGGYEFIILDQVYDLFTLTEEDHHVGAYPPGRYDRVCFRGINYYSEVTASFGRLKQLLGSASRRVALSDVVLRDHVVDLYAVLSMLYDDFSLIRTRKTIEGLTKSYEADCNRVCGIFAYCREDDNVISGCLSRINSTSGYAPGSIPAMREFLRKSCAYMSEEELFLRVMKALSEQYFGGKYAATDSMIGYLSRIDEMDGCLFRVCFSDQMKELLETRAAHDRIAAMSTEEKSTLFSVFLEYGVYHFLNDLTNRVKGLRIRRDNSGFEYLARELFFVLGSNENVFSIITEGDDLTYKCVQIARMTEDRDLTLPLKPPYVAVFSSAERAAEAYRHLSGMLSERLTVTRRIPDLGENAAAHLLVTDMAHLRATAADIRIGSLIVADMTANIVPLKLDINRAVAYGAEKIYLIGSYGDLGGTLLDHWQKLLQETQGALPFVHSELMLEKGSFRSYTDAVTDMNDVYTLLRTTVRHGCPHHVRELMERFYELFVKCGAQLSLPEWEAEMDLEYIARVGTFYENVFRNTASVGDKGETVMRTHLEYTRDEKGKPVAHEVSATSKVAFFNICTKALRRECDQKIHNCADCPDYARLRANDYSVMADSIDSFFVNSIDYDAKMEEEIRHLLNRRQMDNEYILRVLHDLTSEKLQVDERYQKAQAILRRMEKTVLGPGLMMVEYADVTYIRDLVYRTFSRALKKYYIPVLQLCKDRTDAAQVAFRSLDECVSHIYTDR